jgi:hypothetical protein
MIAFIGTSARKFYAGLGSALPDAQLVVRRHRVIGQQRQALFARQSVDFVRIAQATVGIPVLQKPIEFRIAVAGVAIAVAERSVHAQQTLLAQ